MDEITARVERQYSVSRRWVPLILAAILATFFVATAFVNWKLQRIDVATLGITDNTAPSIEQLANARSELRRVETLLERQGDELRAGRTADTTAALDAQLPLDVAIDAYLAFPSLPEERDLWLRVSSGRAELRSVLAAYVRASDSGDVDAASTMLTGPVHKAIRGLFDTLTDTIRANAVGTLDVAREIRDVRRQTAVLAVTLDVVCAVVAIVGFVLVVRMNRAHVELLNRHRRLLEERATELEAFAGRVAHDVLSPLNNVSLSLHLASDEDDAGQRAKLADRGARALERIKRLVDGLLAFARAGGKPSDGATARLGASVEELGLALGPVAAEANASLVIGPTADHELACNGGVLTSLLSNLVGNAIKYLGDAAVRRVEVRTRDLGSKVRVEVIDTGPGIPPGMEERLFEPYVRAPGAREAGFGLGLATVKRLAEAHGGSVGVRSVPGEGSTFWFELPKAAREQSEARTHAPTLHPARTT